MEPAGLVERARRHRGLLTAGVTLCALGCATWRLLGPTWVDLEYLPVLLLAGLGAWLGGAQRSGRAGLGWRLVSAAWLVSALAVTLWFAGRWLAGLTAVGTVLWNAYYGFMVAGLVVMTPGLRGPGARWRATLDAAIVGAACLLLVYFFVVRNHADLVTLIMNGVGEPSVLVASAVLLSRDRGDAPERELGAGALLATVADLSHAAARTGVAIAAWSDVALCISALLIAHAGLRPPGGRQRLRVPIELGLRALGHLPSLSAAALLGALIAQTASDDRGGIRVLAIGATIVVALLLVSLASARYATEVEEDARAAQTERLGATQRYVALGQIAGAAVHDLNNMICVIDGVAEELRTLAPVPPGVGELEHASRRAAEVCRDLLALGARRTEAPTELTATVLGLESLLRRVVPRQLAFEVVTDGALVVAADRSQLEMALVNLVTNARDATRRGSIVLRAERCVVAPGDRFARRGVAPGTWARLAVCDTGSGMAPEVAARAFQPFFTTKGERGTGLGLAQVAELATSAGGHALVDTVPAQGTEVSLLLPLAG